MGILVSSSLLIPLLALGQETGRVRAGEQPPPPLKGEIHAIADPAPMRSFKDLCDRADMIVEGAVETDAARVMRGRGDYRVETDFWIAVDRVLKGPSDTRRLVVSEMGGTFGELRLLMNYTLMQRGQRYVLFLYEDKSQARPPVPGLTRYQDNVFYGRYLVEDGTVRSTFPVSETAQYNGMTVDQFRAEIRKQLGK